MVLTALSATSSQLAPRGRQAVDTVGGPFHRTEERETATIEGLQRILVGRDGHCFYHAVLVGIHIPDEMSAIMELRGKVANEILSNLDKYRVGIRLLGHNTDGEVEEYINTVRSSNQFAGDVEIAALARVLGRPIVVLNQKGERQNLIAEEEGEPVFLMYDGVNHYDALVATNSDAWVILGRALSDLGHEKPNSQEGQDDSMRSTKPS